MCNTNPLHHRTLAHKTHIIIIYIKYTYITNITRTERTETNTHTYTINNNDISVLLAWGWVCVWVFLCSCAVFPSQRLCVIRFFNSLYITMILIGNDFRIGETHTQLVKTHSTLKGYTYEHTHIYESYVIVVCAMSHVFGRWVRQKLNHLPQINKLSDTTKHTIILFKHILYITYNIHRQKPKTPNHPRTALLGTAGQYMIEKSQNTYTQIDTKNRHTHKHTTNN